MVLGYHYYLYAFYSAPNLYRINKEQYFYLCELSMTYAFSIVETLSNWISSGMHDFFHLPCSMKTELSIPVYDEVCLRIKQSGHGQYMYEL